MGLWPKHVTICLYICGNGKGQFIVGNRKRKDIEIGWLHKNNA